MSCLRDARSSAAPDVVAGLGGQRFDSGDVRPLGRLLVDHPQSSDVSRAAGEVTAPAARRRQTKGNRKRTCTFTHRRVVTPVQCHECGRGVDLLERVCPGCGVQAPVQFVGWLAYLMVGLALNTMMRFLV